jgi:hypothetical protein
LHQVVEERRKNRIRRGASAVCSILRLRFECSMAAAEPGAEGCVKVCDVAEL